MRRNQASPQSVRLALRPLASRRAASGLRELGHGALGAVARLVRLTALEVWARVAAQSRHSLAARAVAGSAGRGTRSEMSTARFTTRTASRMTSVHPPKTTGIVTRADGAVDRVADPRPVEHRLGQDRRPASIAPRSRPMKVTTGISAFFICGATGPAPRQALRERGPHVVLTLRPRAAGCA